MPHSPSPWDGDTESPFVLDANGVSIVSGIGPHSGKEQAANAKLIAAAPELLAACQEFCRKVDAGQAHSKRSYEQMAAAIEKATS